MTLRVLIADDEQMARKRLVRLLTALPDTEIAGEARSGLEVLERVAAGGVDLLLLDIRMPGMSGPEALALLGADAPLVVFTTAHADHALEAFEAGAVDYVLKPIDPGRLRQALERARQRRPGAGERSLERLPLPTRRGVEMVPFAAISCARIDGATVALDTDRGTFFTELPLSELQRRLPSDRFARVHRQAIVNLERVLRLEAVDTGGYLAHLDSGQRVAVSRKSARDLRRRWGL